MMTFVAIAAVMVAMTLAWLLTPLLRTRPAVDVDRASANLGILHDQLADLERDHAAGLIGAAQYAETRAELERRVLDEVRTDDTARTATTRRGPRLVPWLIAWCVPIAAGLLYYRLGDPQAFNPLIAKAGGESAHAQSPEQFEQMLKALEARLQREPDNADGWSMLARSYYQMGRFPEASAAYARLTQLIADDASLLADYADAMAMAQGRKIAGKPLELINRALKIDPLQWKALAMAGTEAFDRQDYKGAATLWEKLYGSLPADAPMKQQLAGSINEARQRAGMPQLAAAPAAAAPPAMRPVEPGKAAAEASPHGAAGARVAGTVTLSAQLRQKVAPEDSVIIFARAAEGSRMPLALMRVQAKDLPKTFALDDSMAMSPEFKLSKFEQVIVGARVSKSGSPMPQKGDLEGLSKPVKIGRADVAITIDTELR